MTTKASEGVLNPQSRKNYIINGNFDIWQRGTSQTTSGYGSDDRWGNSNTGSTKITTRELLPLDAINESRIPTCFSRTVVSSVVGSSNSVFKYQKIEDVRVLQNRKVTVSFYAKADSTKNISIELVQDFGSGGSPSSPDSFDRTKIELTSSWRKFSVTFTIPSVSGKL